MVVVQLGLCTLLLPILNAAVNPFEVQNPGLATSQAPDPIGKSGTHKMYRISVLRIRTCEPAGVSIAIDLQGRCQ